MYSPRRLEGRAASIIADSIIGRCVDHFPAILIGIAFDESARGAQKATPGNPVRIISNLDNYKRQISMRGFEGLRLEIFGTFPSRQPSGV